MRVTKGKKIIVTLQLIQYDNEVEDNATVTYKILDSNGVIEIISSREALYNEYTKSYIDELDVEEYWSDQEIGSYLIVWNITNSEREFPTTLTEPLQVSMDESKIDRILGLVHENIYIDQTEFDEFENLISSRLRIYSDSNSVGTDENVLSTYIITSDSNQAGRFTSWKQVLV